MIIQKKERLLFQKFFALGSMPLAFTYPLMKRFTYLLILIVLTVVSCQPSSKTPDPVTPINNTDFYLGADLSYVNEMEDCGAQYKNQDGELEDPFLIFENE